MGVLGLGVARNWSVVCLIDPSGREEENGVSFVTSFKNLAVWRRIKPQYLTNSRHTTTVPYQFDNAGSPLF